MPLPKLTHLQFAVIDSLGTRKFSGCEVRDRLKMRGVRKTLAAFYQLMSRLEKSGFVEGWYEPLEIDGHTIKERWYKVTGTGAAAWADTRDMYMHAAATDLMRGRKGGLAGA